MKKIMEKAYERLNCIREAMVKNRNTYTYKKVVYKILPGEMLLVRISDYTLVIFLGVFAGIYLIEKELWRFALYTVIAYLVCTFAVPVLLELGNKLRK